MISKLAVPVIVVAVGIAILWSIAMQILDWYEARKWDAAKRRTELRAKAREVHSE